MHLHVHRRPAALRLRGGGVPGLAVVVVLLATALAGCRSDPGPLTSDAAPLTGKVAQTCASFLETLPTTLAGLDAREVIPADAPVRAWGEGLVLTCDAPQPPSFNKFAGCEQVRGVGWYFPQDQYNATGSELLATAVGYQPRVSLLVPAQYRGDVSLEAFSDLADYIKPALTLVKPCR